ncbi:hypothetical protein H4R21_002317, partial [Coemansia helicoidea]
MHIARLAGVCLLCLAGTRADTHGTKTVVISLATGSHGEIIPMVLTTPRPSRDVMAAETSGAGTAASVDVLGASPQSVDSSAGGSPIEAPANKTPEEQGSLSDSDSPAASEADTINEYISGAVESFIDQVSRDAASSVESDMASDADAESAPDDTVHDSDSDSDSEGKPSASKAVHSGAIASRCASLAWPIALCIGA